MDRRVKVTGKKVIKHSACFRTTSLQSVKRWRITAPFMGFGSSAKSIYTNRAIKEDQRNWPHHELFPTVGLAGWTGEQPRSCSSCLFCKETLKLQRNQPAIRPPLSGNFKKKPSFFIKINPRSNSPGSGKFAKKTYSFHKINPRVLILFQNFFRKTLEFT